MTETAQQIIDKATVVTVRPGDRVLLVAAWDFTEQDADRTAFAAARHRSGCSRRRREPDMSAYLRLDDGTTWPDPADPREVEWRLRYGEPDRTDQLFAASVLAAYRQLFELPARRRNEQVSALRRAAAAVPVEQEGAGT